jgi:hypothetical protein
MKYENFSITSKLEVEKLLTGNNEDIIKAIIASVNSIKEWEWSQDLCLKYIKHNDFWVAKTAINGIGDVVRIHGKLDVSKVKKSFSQISNERLKPIINSVMDDINIFLK